MTVKGGQRLLSLDTFRIFNDTQSRGFLALQSSFFYLRSTHIVSTVLRTTRGRIKLTQASNEGAPPS